jgi:hypothetical protein
MKKSARVLLYFGLDCGMLLLTSRNPKNCWCLSHIFRARFVGKDHGLSTCKPWSKQAGGWINFCTKQLRTLNSYQIFMIKKSKIYSGWCSCQVLSNGTTLFQIQSGQTVPLRGQQLEILSFISRVFWHGWTTVSGGALNVFVNISIASYGSLVENWDQ